MSTSGAGLFAAEGHSLMYHNCARRVAQTRARLSRGLLTFASADVSRSLQVAPREAPGGERYRKPYAEHVNEYAHAEGWRVWRRRSEGRGRERYDDVVHAGEDDKAVDDAADVRHAREHRELAAREVIDCGPDERDEEVEEQAERGRGRPAVERGLAE